MPRGPKRLQLIFTGKNLTHFGGLFLLQQFIKQIGLRHQLSHAIPFPQRNNRYSFADLVLAICYPMMLGLGRVETMRLLQRNGVFQYLTGLPAYPDPTSLRRFLLRWTPQTMQKLRHLHDRFLRYFTQQPRPLTSVIFDLDSTVLTVYGHLQGARVGYNPHKRGRPSYHPLLCFEGHRQDCWHAEFRPGNAFTGAGGLACLQACLAKVPPTVRSIRVRGDVGFYNRDLVEFLDEKRWGYAIVAKLTQPIQYRLPGLRYRRIRPGLEVATFRYRPHDWRKTHRFIVVRKLLPEEHSPQGQLTLFQLDDWAYHVYVTNLALRPVNVWRFYNQRATVELLIKELKSAYPLAKIPTRFWHANEAYFHLLLFTYNLVHWFKRLCLPPRWHSATLRTIQTELLLVPAELVRPQGAPFLKLSANFLHRDTFHHALRRIRRLRIPTTFRP